MIIEKIHNELYKNSLDTDSEIIHFCLHILSSTEDVNLILHFRYVEGKFDFFNDDYSYSEDENSGDISVNDYIESIIENYYESDYDIVLYNLSYIESLS